MLASQIGQPLWSACPHRAWMVLLACLLFGVAQPGWAYSLLTHEELVDIVWKDQIEPLLLKRFPAATPAQLRQAHAYAYGGCLIQDIGYYPFGNEFFSDLTHYVRTGDFITNLMRESADLDQYAFALGALAHYSDDNSGHPLVNRAVALAFPKLRAKYGESVTCGRLLRPAHGLDRPKAKGEHDWVPAWAPAQASNSATGNAAALTR